MVIAGGVCSSPPGASGFHVRCGRPGMSNNWQFGEMRLRVVRSYGRGDEVGDVYPGVWIVCSGASTPKCCGIWTGCLGPD